MKNNKIQLKIKDIIIPLCVLKNVVNPKKKQFFV